MNTNTISDTGIIHAESAVAVVGAGSVFPQDLDQIMALAPLLVAADGGAGVALAHGHIPDLVIGDFDSLPEFASERLTPDRLIHVDDQDTTDFEKCLARIRAPLILAVGFTGLRLDHELAVMSALARHPEIRCLVLGSHDVVFHAPRQIALDLEVGSRFSLFPFAAVTGRSEGLRWPIDGITFSPSGRVGTSNEVTGPVRLSFDNDGMLILVPREALGSVRSALLPG